MGWDEAAWHPVSFQEAWKWSLCRLILAKPSHCFLADLKQSFFFFSRYETIAGIIAVLHKFKHCYMTYDNYGRATLYTFGLIILYRL
jgi:hypothetical protein